MITVLGSINLDLVATTRKLPKPGETVPGTGFATAAGGKGANQALAALRAGGRMRLVGAVGSDDFSEQALFDLKAEGADLTGVRHLDCRTGIAVILVGGKGENVIVVVPGANGLVEPDMAETALAGLSSGDIVLLQNEIPAETVERALDLARAQGVATLYNTAPFTGETARLAQKADVVIANETEFDALTHTPISGNRLEAMYETAMANKQTIIVTLGPDGVLAVAPDGQTVEMPALAIKPVDTVGAGDTFCGYLAAALDAGDSLETALRTAAAAGSLACLKPGAQPAIPYARDVSAALKSGSR